jgi:hypothetical protein
MVLISGQTCDIGSNTRISGDNSRTCSTETLFCIIRKKRRNPSEQEEALNSLSVPNDVTVESIPASEKSTNLQLLNPNTRG